MTETKPSFAKQLWTFLTTQNWTAATVILVAAAALVAGIVLF